MCVCIYIYISSSELDLAQDNSLVNQKWRLGEVVLQCNQDITKFNVIMTHDPDLKKKMNNESTNTPACAYGHQNV